MSVNRVRLTKDIGSRIYALRASKQLIQSELENRISARMGETVSKGQVGRWERGENLPGVDHLLALAAELDTSLEELVTGPEAFEGRVLKRVLLQLEPRISRIEKHVGLSSPDGSPA